MEQLVTTAQCRFCGQVVQIPEEMTIPQAEEYATMNCDCPVAMDYRTKKVRREKAMKNVEKLFGSEAEPEDKCPEEIVDLLREGVEQVYSGYLAKITLNMRGGLKACISQNAKGEINVERIETKKKKLTE